MLANEFGPFHMFYYSFNNIDPEVDTESCWSVDKPGRTSEFQQYRSRSGLKYSCSVRNTAETESLPSLGVWIEITGQCAAGAVVE